jgi:FixJ family two-component response regulator/two-component sensor histidine kinase
LAIPDFVTPSTDHFIFFIDRDESVSNDLNSKLLANGFTPMFFTDIGNALVQLSQVKPEIIILDTDFPGLDVINVLKTIRKQDPDPVFILTTKTKEESLSINRKTAQVFEILTKPIDEPELIGKLKHSSSLYLEKKKHLTFVGETEEKMRNELEWLIWKEHNKLADKVYLGKTLIANLKNSLLQGMGLGSLVSLIELLELQKKTDGDIASVPAKTLNRIFSSITNIHSWLDNVENIRRGYENVYQQEEIKEEEFKQIIHATIQEMESFRKIKDHTIVMGRFDIPKIVIFNKHVLGMVIREFLMNAFKYSPSNSKIHIAMFKARNSLSMVLMNDIQKMEGGITGVPEEMENEVFEPFVRLNNVFDERYFGEEFSMGTGLSIVQIATYQVGGKVFLYEVMDYLSQDNPRKRVAAELIIPSKLKDPNEVEK